MSRKSRKKKCEKKGHRPVIQERHDSHGLNSLSMSHDAMQELETTGQYWLNDGWEVKR